MALPSISIRPSKTSPPPPWQSAPKKRRRGGQPGNQNARKFGTFSRQQPGLLAETRASLRLLHSIERNNLVAPNEGEIEELFDAIFEETEKVVRKRKGDQLNAFLLQAGLIQTSARMERMHVLALLPQRTLETIAHDPFALFEQDYRACGITRDADSFFFVPQKSARNSAIPGVGSLPSPNVPIWGGAGGGVDSPLQTSSSVWGGTGGGVDSPL